jgi:hypothetical protein
MAFPVFALSVRFQKPRRIGTAAETQEELASPEVEHGDFPSAQLISYRDIGCWSSGKI